MGAMKSLNDRVEESYVAVCLAHEERAKVDKALIEARCEVFALREKRDLLAAMYNSYLSLGKEEERLQVESEITAHENDMLAPALKIEQGLSKEYARLKGEIREHKSLLVTLNSLKEMEEQNENA